MVQGVVHRAVQECSIKSENCHDDQQTSLGEAASRRRRRNRCAKLQPIRFHSSIDYYKYFRNFQPEVFKIEEPISNQFLVLQLLESLVLVRGETYFYWNIPIHRKNEK